MQSRLLLLTLALLSLPNCGTTQGFSGSPGFFGGGGMGPSGAWPNAGTKRATQEEIQRLVATLGPGAYHRISGCIPPPPWGEGTPADEAAKNLVLIGPPAVADLIPVVADKNDGRRTLAVEILGRIGDRRATPALIEAFPREIGDNIRQSIIESLAMLQDRRAEETFLLALKDANGFVQVEAMRGAGSLKSRRAIEPLITILRTNPEPMPSFGGSPLLAQTAAGALAAIGSPAFPALLDVLTDAKTEPYALTCAIPAASFAGDIRVVPALIALLNHSDDRVCAAAANALAKWKDPRSVAPLLHTLRAGTGNSGYAAAITLAGIGGLDALTPLIRAASDTDGAVSHPAANALLYIQDRRAVPMLVKILESGPEEARKNAVATLGQMKDSRAIRPLVTMLSDPEWSVRLSAAAALYHYDGPKVVTALLKALNDSASRVRIQAIQSLQERSERRIFAALEKLTNDPDKFVSAAAQNALRLHTQRAR